MWSTFRQRGLSLFCLLLFSMETFAFPHEKQRNLNKSVAIVGAGSAGLAMLRTFFDLQEELQTSLDVVLYEQRGDIGGIWLPDPRPVHPPTLPETPLYPHLKTNLAVPTMTYPSFPYPPGTPLFANHEYVEKYHRDFASHYNLMPHIKLNHTVLSASWVGTPEEGCWDVRVADKDGGEMRRSFDHLVVATGHYHYPRIPTFPGQDEWQRNGPGGSQREIQHSIFYRDPEQYTNQTVVVVGSGPSSVDAASQVAQFAQKVYLSIRTDPPARVPVEYKPEIAYFTPDAVVFADDSRVHGVDAVILATGYDLRIPFLETTGEITVKPGSNERDRGLTTNLRYLFPLHRHVFSLSSSYPPTALAFIGLPVRVYSCMSDVAQSMYVARIMVNASLLGPREELLRELDASEDDVRSRGDDPYRVGHTLVNGFNYQDLLIDSLKEWGAIPDDGAKFVDPWRREAAVYVHLRRGWKRVEKLGLQTQWLKGVETEAEWADLMKRVNQWQRDWEMEQGQLLPEKQIVF